jgi:hypothetical protein
VSARGRTDSLAIQGIVPSTDPYVAKLRSRMAATAFIPATLNGCAVPSIYEMEFDLSLPSR